ncbi:MAG: AraC family transcriptional regulator [Cyanobacteria bacterium P01_G01_bin.38]
MKPLSINHPLSLPPVLSSQGMGLSNGILNEYKLPPGELALPAYPDPVICFTLGQPYQLFQKFDDHTHQKLSHSGQFSLVPAEMPSYWQWAQAAHIVIVQVDSDFLDSVATELGQYEPHSIEFGSAFEASDEHLTHLVMLLRSESQGRGVGTQLYTDSLMQALAICLLQRYSKASNASWHPIGKLTRSALQQLVAYIEANLAEDLTLQQLSRIAGLSSHYFATSFKNATGMTPHQYVIQRRVQKAKRLLICDRTLTIAQVAATVGFSDQSHLCRHLRRQLKVTPKQLRQQS